MLSVQMPQQKENNYRRRTRSKSRDRNLLEGQVSKVFHGRSYPNDYEDYIDREFTEKSPRVDSSDHMEFSKGQKIMNKYVLFESIGQGAFGKVISVKDLTNTNEYAMKIIRNVRKYRESARYEIFVLQYLSKSSRQNKYCIELIDYFNYFGHACIVFKKYGQSVYDFLKSNDFVPFTANEVRHMSYQLINGVDFLHSNKVIHTDLKPENIILVDDNFDAIYDNHTKKVVKKLKCSSIKIIDFGNSVFFSDTRSKIICTRHYRPIEVILELNWNEKIDVWSLGCILFELYTGITMFQAHSNRLHLALIEEIIGRVPTKMIYKANSKYYRHGEFDWDALGSDELKKVDRVRQLQSYFNPLVANDWQFYCMINGMLELDPKYRRSMYRFMQCDFLKSFC